MTELVPAVPIPERRFPAPAMPGVDAAFWRWHALWPLATWLLLFGLIEGLSLDRGIAHSLFYSADAHQWLGGGSGDWWAHRLIHDGGRWLVRAAAAGALVAWLASFAFAAVRGWRRPAGYVFLAMVLSVGIVGILKTVTNVDCPWDLAEFGGTRPYVALFAHRPADLPHAECFPGSHSASGFALVAFYFILRDRARIAARWALLAACLVGMVFSFAQEARGAHFLSHDLSSVIIIWSVQLALYAALLKPRPARA